MLAALAQCAAAPRPHATLTFPTLTFPGGALTGSELSVAAARVAASVAPGSRVAVWATPTLDTAVTILGALAGGAVVVPLNPAVGRVELSHILGECRPRALLTSADADADTPAAVVALPRLSVDWRAGGEGEGDAGHAAGVLRDRAERAEDAALIIYTSGTTGPPKGAVLSHRALAACVHGLAHVWRWTADDVLVHALPLFHVHGLVLGLIGPLLVGCPLVHTGSFDPASLADALQRGGTMLFGVPTMYHRLGLEAERNADVAVALRQARLLISGSAPLASADRARIERLTDRTVIERYGLTETLIVCAMPPEAARVGVGVPIPGIEMRLVDDAGTPIEAGPSETGADDVMGDVEIRGATLFSGYLDRPDATSAAFRDGWFKTGDTARRDADGLYTIVGRSSLDVIKTGGFKVGAGEVEDALRTHPEIADVAVTGEPDADLGQRIVAWIVPHADRVPASADLEAYVAGLLSAHKRPRDVRFLDALPRNAMGKVEKRKLAITR